MKITRDHLAAVPNQATPLQGVAHRGGRPSVATGPPYDRPEGVVVSRVRCQMTSCALLVPTSTRTPFDVNHDYPRMGPPVSAMLAGRLPVLHSLQEPWIVSHGRRLRPRLSNDAGSRWFFSNEPRTHQRQAGVMPRVMVVAPTATR